MAEKDKALLKVIGARIRTVRTSQNMSQQELSDKAGLSLPHISDVELGKTNPLLLNFVRIAEALQVSTDSLLRPDIPEVKHIYKNEAMEVFSDCTASEMEAIMKIVREVKTTLHTEKSKYTESAPPV